MSKRKKIVFLTGAGISQESGIDTFRDNGGLWEKYSIEQVATASAMADNTETVLGFYNERRQQLKGIYPNQAHTLIPMLSEYFDVDVVTQNVDDLHEKGGSKSVLHIHGELTKARSMADVNLVSDIGYNDINMGDLATDGIQLRPNIVLFGENVPLMEIAQSKCFDADILVVIGTSLNVYPAASLIECVNGNTRVFNINPDSQYNVNVEHIEEKASTGMEFLYNKLIKELKNES